MVGKGFNNGTTADAYVHRRIHRNVVGRWIAPK